MYELLYACPSSIYSCSIGHIWEHEFCHLGCWAVKGKFLKRRNFCLSMLLFGVVFSCFHWQKFNFLFFGHENIKKPPKKVAYLSRISVVSEIFPFTAQQPKWQNSCSQIWPIDQLYIELGYRLRFLKLFWWNRKLWFHHHFTELALCILWLCILWLFDL